MKKVLELEKKLNIRFKDKTLLLKALTHRSYSLDNNEKLEFLGDRVLGLVISKTLFERYPGESEGTLDKRFAKLVNKKTCLKISKNLKLDQFVFLGKSYEKKSSVDAKILSDVCEALLGAIYLDQGLRITENVILRLWEKELFKSNVTIIDSKTKLQEFSLKKFRRLPIYKLENIQGPSHSPTFKISVKIINSKKFYGTGTTKKDAEQNAASEILNNLN